MNRKESIYSEKSLTDTICLRHLYNKGQLVDIAVMLNQAIKSEVVDIEGLVTGWSEEIDTLQGRIDSAEKHRERYQLISATMKKVIKKLTEINKELRHEGGE